MIPSEYRLGSVFARLIERLEGTRPTYGGDAERALAAFREIAARHVEAALTEYRDNAVDGDPEAHGAFLRREILETLLPRYTRLAVAMNLAEAGGFGFGKLAGPVGIPVLVVASALGMVLLARWAAWWESWPLIALDLTLPLWPSILAWLQRRSHLRALEALVADAERIQDHERGFMTASEVDAVRKTTVEAQRPSPRREVQRE